MGARLHSALGRSGEEGGAEPGYPVFMADRHEQGPDELTPAIPFHDVVAWFKKRVTDSERALRSMPAKHHPAQCIRMPGEIRPPAGLWMNLDDLD